MGWHRGGRNVGLTLESRGPKASVPLPTMKADGLPGVPQLSSPGLPGHILGLCHMLPGLLKGFWPQHCLLCHP